MKESYLKKRHHNDNFLAYIEKFMPQWKFHREELNRLHDCLGDWKY